MSDILRLVLEYEEGLKSLASLFPRCGTIISSHTDKYGVVWQLIALDNSFECQLKIAEPFQYRLATIASLLITPRYQGDKIGSNQLVHVHLLLVEPAELPMQQTIDASKYHHAAWGKCRFLNDA